MTKKFILNADDFGMNSAFNTAVLEGCKSGILKSASIVANGEGYDDAVKRVIPECQNLGIGVHLNIIEGKSILNNIDEISDINRDFINSFPKLLIKSLNFYNKNFIKDVEYEFKAQIEKVLSSGINITHLDSHVHVHAIPPIFEVVCKLAKEYNIKQVRTQFEKPYLIPDIYIHLNKKYPVNLIKIALLNTFSTINKKTIKKYNLETNDYLIGVGYTSMMNNMTVSYGLNILKNKENIVAEALIHPCRYEDGIIDNHFTEYQITQSEKLKTAIENMGYEIGNYSF